MSPFRTVITVAAVSVALTSCGADAGKEANPQQTSNPASRPAGGAAPAQTLPASALAELTSSRLATHKSVRIIASTKRPEGVDTFSTIMTVSGGKPVFEMSTAIPAENGGASPGNITVVSAGGFVYAKLPAGQSPAQPGKPWLKYPVNGDDPIVGLAEVGDSIFDFTRPENSVFKTAGATVAAPRSERLGTTQTTHYSVTVDLAKFGGGVELTGMLAATGGEAGQLPGLPASVSTALERPGRLGKAQAAQVKAAVIKAAKGITLSHDLWVDGAGLPVKHVITMPSGKGQITSEISYSDWGKLSVTVPTAGQVTAG